MYNNHNKVKFKTPQLLYAALFIIVIIGLSIGSYYISRHYVKSINQNQTKTEVTLDKPKETPDPTPAPETPKTPPPLPASAEISMWFAPQAPYADWSEPWQNACEEAAIITVKHYLDQNPLNKEIMYNEVLQLVDWQSQNWGENRDLTSEETVKLAELNYGLRGEVIYNYDIDLIKRYVANGVPVIVPANGKLLNNPHFRNGGPTYHMLVIKGYDGAGNFITNDPGIREGEGYIYPYDTIINSVKNPSGGDKSVFVLYKQISLNGYQFLVIS